MSEELLLAPETTEPGGLCRLREMTPGKPVAGLALVAVHPFRNEPAQCEGTCGLRIGDWVVIRDQTGEDIGRVVAQVETDAAPAMVVRRATDEDMKLRDELLVKAESGLGVFRQLVRQFKLPMKAVDAHLRFDRREISFYFVSDERLNFRALHKAVSSALNLRVVIRQVGVRDYSRVSGGVGTCGRVLCCASFLGELKPVTLRMARQQNLFVEPAKISGVCGKLLCCLRFEDDEYRKAMEEFPRIGAMVETDKGKGKVMAIDIFGRRVTVQFSDGEVVVPLGELK
jgi:cell fate regulator YaaT (PSP1 superfamily)